jgi:hypothetical protein
MTSLKARAAAAAILLAMLALYYSGGLRFQAWGDSGGYLGQALGIVGGLPYARPSGRSLGYPALVAAALTTPAPLLALVLAQLAITGLSLAGLYLALTRWLVPALSPRQEVQGKTRNVALIGIALVSLYSPLHVHAGALLSESLFAALALAAVLATVWFARLEPGTARPRLKAAAVAVVIGLDLLVKPHWLLAAATLGLVVAAQLWRLTPSAGSAPTPLSRLGRALAALAVPLAAILIVALPDRLLAARYGTSDDVLFGPRTAFCNHAHMIDATLRRRPSLVLQEDARFEAALRQYLADVQQRPGGRWIRLGFDGDKCSYDPQLSRLLDARFPVPEAQARFLLRSVARAALADPLPYLAKVAHQVVLGFTLAFEKFAVHTHPELATLDRIRASYGLGPELARGVMVAPSIGPLQSRTLLKETWYGLAVQAVLAVVFFGLTGLLCGLALLMIAAALARYRRWPADVRRSFATYIGIPLAALLSHHALVALTHSFDIWRYAFNMFYVNLLLIAAAALFALRHLRRRPA